MKSDFRRGFPSLAGFWAHDWYKEKRAHDRNKDQNKERRAHDWNKESAHDWKTESRAHDQNKKRRAHFKQNTADIQ